MEEYHKKSTQNNDSAKLQFARYFDKLTNTRVLKTVLQQSYLTSLNSCLMRSNATIPERLTALLVRLNLRAQIQ